MHNLNLATLAVLITCSSIVLAVQKCGNTPIAPDETRIVGGHEAVPYSWPWQVEMCMQGLFSDCSLRCGGSLINSQWVMSAAHCVDGYVNHTGKFRLKIGTYKYKNSNEDGEIVAEIESIFIHPKYEKPHEFSHDMSLLKLKKPVQFTNHIQPVCLPGNISDLITVEGKSCFVTGWGATSEGGPLSPVLQQVTVPFLTMKHCIDEYGQNMIDDTMVCAGSKGVDSCQGDSGGPLVTKHKESGRWFQAGIVSWGLGCAEKGHAGVYSRVSSMCDFIKKTIGYDVCIHS